VTAAPRDARAERVGARATGVGVGLLVFMIVWLVGARVTDLFWGPSSAVVALALSVVAGIVVAVVAGHRLVRGLT
jgi:dipeptide/tripeptide permease